MLLFWMKTILDYEYPFQMPLGSQKFFNARDVARQHISYRIAVSDFLMWHDPWVNSRTLVEHLGDSIISIMESRQLARIGVFDNWQNSQSYHVLAIELRAICGTIRSHNFDSIKWDSIVGFLVTVSTICNSLHTTRTPPPWIVMVWNKFTVPKFSVLTWLVLKKHLSTSDRLISSWQDPLDGNIL